MGTVFVENAKIEKYFVCSDGEKPTKIYFDRTVLDSKSLESGSEYIDSFDEHGNLINSYKYLPELRQYTTDF